MKKKIKSECECCQAFLDQITLTEDRLSDWMGKEEFLSFKKEGKDFFSFKKKEGKDFFDMVMDIVKYSYEPLHLKEEFTDDELH